MARPRVVFGFVFPVVLLGAAPVEEVVSPTRRIQGESSPPQDLERRLRALEEQVERLRAALATRPAERSPEDATLEAEIERLLGAAPERPPQPPPRAGPLLNPRISVDVLTVLGAFTPDEPPPLGDHDFVRGFSVPNFELTLENPVDPYFHARAHAVVIVRDGETRLELEEAYVETTSLPANLQVLAGEFFTRFGRHNAIHPHAWEFANVPLVFPRYFGPDNMRNPGVQASWLAPTPFFLEASASVQDPRGENAVSFFGEEDASLGGHPLDAGRAVEGLRDFPTMVRIAASEDLSETTTALAGMSALFGDNATAERARTRILGGDFTLKWRPLAAQKGFPFVAWQTEAIWRSAEVGSFLFDDDGDPATPPVLVADDFLRDFGGYSQVVWGFEPRWTAALRGEYAHGEGGIAPSDDPLRDRRYRLSPAVTFYPSEFSKIRFQVDYDVASHLHDRPVFGFALQFEFLIGEHGAHKF